jgi:hypothetical protein
MRCREGFSDTLVFNAMFPLQGSYLSLKSDALPLSYERKVNGLLSQYIRLLPKGNRSKRTAQAHDLYYNCGCCRDPPQRCYRDLR